MVNLVVLRSASLMVKWERLWLTLSFPSAPSHGIEDSKYSQTQQGLVEVKYTCIAVQYQSASHTHCGPNSSLAVRMTEV